MNICEGCIKQDVCKFREEVSAHGVVFDEPLEITCKYKEVDDWDDGDECPDNPVPWPVYPPYTPTWPTYYPPYPNYYHPTYTGHTSPPCGKEEW